MKQKLFFIIFLFFIIGGCTKSIEKSEGTKKDIEKTKTTISHPLAIEYLRSKDFPASTIEIIDTVTENEHYTKYIVSYLSEGNKIFAALAVPKNDDPSKKLPAIFLNHGYIPPVSYDNTRKYVRYIDFLAIEGFVVCMPDYRGHGKSEGAITSPYFTNGYLTDVLNAMSSVAKLEYVDTTRIAIWGHSLGGTLTQQAMVVDKRIKTGVIWGGVVGTYEDMFYTYQDKIPWVRKGGHIIQRMKEMEKEFGEFSLMNEYWIAISPIAYIDQISGPVQLHHARYDPSVPVELSIAFAQYMEDADKPVELYIYNSHDHNIGDPHFKQAMQRTADFYKKYMAIE